MPRAARSEVPLFPKLSGEALKRGQEGVIGLRVFVDETGNVTQAIVGRSTGHQELDDLGLATAYSWKLQPGSIDGVATPMWHCFSNTYFLRSLISYQVTSKEVEEMTVFMKACDEEKIKLAPGATANIQVPRTTRSHPLPQPFYPPESRARGDQGLIGLILYINESGKVTQARIGKSTGHKALDDAALAGLAAWQLQPGTVDGAPTGMWNCFMITFSAEDQRPYQATPKDREEIDVFNRLCDQERIKRQSSLTQPRSE
jgi:TonB family protein